MLCSIWPYARCFFLMFQVTLNSCNFVAIKGTGNWEKKQRNWENAQTQRNLIDRPNSFFLEVNDREDHRSSHDILPSTDAGEFNRPNSQIGNL